MRRSPKKAFDPEVLLDPTKEQLHLPPFLIDIGNHFGPKVEDIGQIDIGLFGLRIHIADSSQVDRNAVSLGTFDTDDLVRGDAGGLVDLVSLDNPVFDIAFESSDKPDLLEMKLIEPAEIDIGPIDDEDAVRFKPHPSGRNDVMGFSVADNHTRGDVSPVIQEGMDLNRSLSLSELGPLEEAQAETDGGGVECVERVFE